GWADIIDRYLTDMEQKGFEIQIDQIKEKFGGLRLYDSIGHPLFRTINSEEAERKANELRKYIEERSRQLDEESYKTCEYCGKPGELDETGWYKTVCPEHKQARQRKSQ